MNGAAPINFTGPVDLGSMAQAYAATGMPVFPAYPLGFIHPMTGKRCDGKAPATPNGFKAATVDLDQIVRWWRENPDYNIGCTPPPEFAVVDVDHRNGGVESLRSLVAQHGPLCAPTWTVRTGGGGWHLWVRLPDGFDVSRMRGKLADGIDLKHGSKGYVLMPPSVTEQPYQWIDGKDLPWD